MTIQPLKADATKKDCVRWILKELVRKDKMYHLEDDPKEQIDLRTEERAFTGEECEVLKEAVGTLYARLGNKSMCPIAWMMRLERCEARRLGKESVFA